MSKKTIDAAALIARIAECLSEWDGEALAEIANQVLIQKITYVSDSNFEIEGDLECLPDGCF